ncbi:hypothetical protein V1478_004193 [Vespula squamosa]|uniref:Ribosomal protein S19 n=1 Tax=Vespula squamosa TaxID=30214 RepID=A0ABD2BJZ6_VESSQ
MRSIELATKLNIMSAFSSRKRIQYKGLYTKKRINKFRLLKGKIIESIWRMTDRRNQMEEIGSKKKGRKR